MNATEYKGYWGELVASLLLMCKGYRIVARRQKLPQGEIDIIAKKKNILVFVEVKSRKNLDKCFVAITPQQMRRIQQASEVFVSSRKQYANYDIRYDVILVADWSLPLHIENITM